MRQKRLIVDGSPCDADFTDRTLQTARDFLDRPRAYCTNLMVCRTRSPRERIVCSRALAIQMARFALQDRRDIEQVLEAERAVLLADAPDGKFWVYENGLWQVVVGKANVVDHVIAFAKVILDLQPGDRRPFTDDGKLPETGPGPALENAMRDLDDVYGEVGAKNPFR
jgi:hypothetical protein